MNIVVCVKTPTNPLGCFRYQIHIYYHMITGVFVDISTTITLHALLVSMPYVAFWHLPSRITWGNKCGIIDTISYRLVVPYDLGCHKYFPRREARQSLMPSRTWLTNFAHTWPSDDGPLGTVLATCNYYQSVDMLSVYYLTIDPPNPFIMSPEHIVWQSNLQLMAPWDVLA